MICKTPSTRQQITYNEQIILSFWASKNQPLETKAVTKQNPCKVVIAKTTSQRFQTTTDSTEKKKKKMAKNIFLPTSEFGRSKMFLFWLNTKSSCLDRLQLSGRWLQHILPNCGYLIWLDELEVSRWGGKGLACIPLTSPPPPAHWRLPASSPRPARLTAELSGTMFQMFSVKQQTVTCGKKKDILVLMQWKNILRMLILPLV